MESGAASSVAPLPLYMCSNRLEVTRPQAHQDSQVQRNLNSFKQSCKAHRCGSPFSLQGDLVHKASLEAHSRAGQALLSPVISLAHLSSPGSAGSVSALLSLCSLSQETAGLPEGRHSQGREHFLGQFQPGAPGSAFRGSLASELLSWQDGYSRNGAFLLQTGQGDKPRERDCCACSQLGGKILAQLVLQRNRIG